MSCRIGDRSNWKTIYKKNLVLTYLSLLEFNSITITIYLVFFGTFHSIAAIARYRYHTANARWSQALASGWRRLRLLRARVRVTPVYPDPVCVRTRQIYLHTRCACVRSERLCDWADFSFQFSLSALNAISNGVVMIFLSSIWVFTHLFSLSLYW